MIYLQDPDFTLRLGDVREELRELPDESVHCVVTSPPYWGLRDYGTEGQLGLEAGRGAEFGDDWRAVVCGCRCARE